MKNTILSYALKRVCHRTFSITVLEKEAAHGVYALIRTALFIRRRRND